MQSTISARRWALAMFALVCVIVLAADLGLPLPLRRLLALPLVDKIGHFGLFGLLSWLATRAALKSLPGWPPTRVGAASATLLITLAAAEETSQRFIRSRTFSLWDLAASAAGILVMAGVQVCTHIRAARRGRAGVTGKRA